MAAAVPAPIDPAPAVLDLPFRGRWVARNSPATRVPSHGTHLFGTTYAIDLVGVDDRGRSAPRGWRGWWGTEPPERFAGYGRPVLAPAPGRVVSVVAGVADHSARRSPASQVGYLLGQRGRVARGPDAVTGNHVVVALGPEGPYVLLAHLREGTVRVAVGERVRAGEQVAECGNTGNSTEPHVHLQVTDTTRWEAALGLPFVLRRFRRVPGGEVVERGLPADGEVVEPAG